MARIVEYKGETHSLFEWAKILGMSYHTLITRYDKGDRGEELFRTYNIVKCKICGKMFETILSRKLCCSDECAKQNSMTNQRIWLSKQQGKPKPEKKKKLTVTEMAVKAKELGMTYGQYTAMLYMQEGKV